MRHWWVNHKQTFRHEFEGGYIWSPKRKKDGSRNRYYDFMRQVVPGDVVFSYADAALQGAGFATSYCYTCPKPEEFGRIGEYWEVLGWRVDVHFRRFAHPVVPKRHLVLLQPFLAQEPHAPLRSTGDGLQHVYLTRITESLARVLLGLAGSEAGVFMAPASPTGAASSIEPALRGQQEWEDIIQQRILHEAPETARDALIKARIGQGLFKQRVAQIERACRLTFVTNPAHLIGSHIKPWRESTNEERLSGANGLLLTPTADHLFDRGFISFEDSGEVMVSPVADVSSLKRMGLDPDNPPRPMPLNCDQKGFLAYHRREVFLAAE